MNSKTTKEKFRDLISTYEVHKANYCHISPYNSGTLTDNIINIDNTYVGDKFDYQPTPHDNPFHRGWGGHNPNITPVPYIPDNKPYRVWTTDGKNNSWQNFDMEEYEKILSDLNKNAPNKVDKDLINTKLPYNVKVDNYKNLIYEIAVAGFTTKQIRLSLKKDGFLLRLLPKNDDDDLIGDEFKYLCQGLKETEQNIDIFIDWDEYDNKSYNCKLNYGVLSIKVNKREELLNKINIEDNTEEENILLD